jgi:NAD+ synthase (glutamine-hydrolysing)
MAQINPLVGDIHGNTSLVIQQGREAVARFQPDLVVFPELVLTAYPPEDLLLRPSLDLRIEKALQELCTAALPTILVVGYPGREDGRLFNMLALIDHGRLVAKYRKQRLPNYQVFDEKRYFRKGRASLVHEIKGVPVAFTICEDLWSPKAMAKAAAYGARLMININGSPYSLGKVHRRMDVMRERVAEGSMPLVYVNQVGGQDELLFDGASMAMNTDGRVAVQACQYAEALVPVVVEQTSGRLSIRSGEQHALLDREAELYEALVLGLRDYVTKNRFPGVVLGLSGGIDSALTLAIAVDALGNERVHAVMMPFAYTARMSMDDAEEEARYLGVNYRVIPIGPMYESFMQALTGEFAGMPPDLTEQNLQARCRGVALMAISNKKGLLVLTTGNKSEMAVGYSTLYGDMAGGFDVLKDVPKMQVYALAEYRNRIAGDDKGPIPRRVIERPPSAELAPGQVDEDNLPPYPELDRILELYIEQDWSLEAIVAEGHEREVVAKVIRLVDLNEYKRRQAPVGVRISERGFGRDRRYPITSGWKPGD